MIKSVSWEVLLKVIAGKYCISNGARHRFPWLYYTIVSNISVNVSIGISGFFVIQLNYVLLIICSEFDRSFSLSIYFGIIVLIFQNVFLVVPTHHCFIDRQVFICNRICQNGFCAVLIFEKMMYGKLSVIIILIIQLDHIICRFRTNLNALFFCMIESITCNVYYLVFALNDSFIRRFRLFLFMDR